MNLLEQIGRRLTNAIDFVAWHLERIYGRLNGSGPQVRRRQYYPRSRAHAFIQGAIYCLGIAAVLGVLVWAAYQDSPQDATSTDEDTAVAASAEASVASSSKQAPPAKSIPVKTKKPKVLRPAHAPRPHKAKRHAKRAHRKAKRSHKRRSTTIRVSQPAPAPSPTPVSSPSPAPAPVHTSPAPSSGGGGGGGGGHSSPPPRPAQQPAAVPFDSSG
jgi:hypothetical protein